MGCSLFIRFLNLHPGNSACVEPLYTVSEPTFGSQLIWIYIVNNNLYTLFRIVYERVNCLSTVS